jgi:hypothetical protein
LKKVCFLVIGLTIFIMVSHTVIYHFNNLDEEFNVKQHIAR